MANPIPANNCNQLIDELTGLVRSGAVSEFSLARIEREARKLLRVDPGKGHTILGIISAMRGNEEAMRSHHQTALRLTTPENIVPDTNNFAFSLIQMGYFDEAFSMTSGTYEKSGSSVSLYQMISAALALGLNGRAMSLIADWEKMTGKKHPETGRLKAESNGVVRESVSNDIETLFRERQGLWKKLAEI